MTSFQFITLRYRHDAVTGEFANVGIVVFTPGEFLGARFNLRTARLKCFFGEVDENHLKKLIAHIQAQFHSLSKTINTPSLSGEHDLEKLARHVFPQDDSALQWSSLKKGVTPDIEAELNRLFKRLVTRYEKESFAGTVAKMIESHEEGR